MKIFSKKTEKETFEAFLKKLNKFDTHRKVIKNFVSKEYKKQGNTFFLQKIIENTKLIKINSFEISEFETIQEVPLIKFAILKVNYNIKKYSKDFYSEVEIRTFEGKPVLNFINQLVNNAYKDIRNENKNE